MGERRHQPGRAVSAYPTVDWYEIEITDRRHAEQNAVGRPEVQGFVGSLVGFGASKGMFVTTSTFSVGARQYADQIPQRIILVDGTRLTDLMIEHDVGVRIIRRARAINPGRGIGHPGCQPGARCALGSVTKRLFAQRWVAKSPRCG